MGMADKIETETGVAVEQTGQRTAAFGKTAADATMRQNRSVT